MAIKFGHTVAQGGGLVGAPAEGGRGGLRRLDPTLCGGKSLSPLRRDGSCHCMVPFGLLEPGGRLFGRWAAEIDRGLQLCGSSGAFPLSEGDRRLNLRDPDQAVH